MVKSNQSFSPGPENIPIVSLKQLISIPNPSRNDWIQTAENFTKALSTMGFVYLKDHGISEDKIQNLFNESISFFQLPMEKKLKYTRDFERTFHGYSKFQDSKMGYKEFFDASIYEYEAGGNYCYPEEECSNFKPAMDTISNDCTHITEILLQLLGLGLKLDDQDYFLKFHKALAQDSKSIGNFSQIRSIYYPMIPDGEAATQLELRCDAHTDYGTLTLLFQDSMDGLEILSRDTGEWIPANPIPGHILMNVGDLLEKWSGGQFPSTIHRVIVPEDEHKRKCSRQSIAFFMKPDNDTVVAPTTKVKIINHFTLKESIIEEEAINAGEHFRRRTFELRD